MPNSITNNKCVTSSNNTMYVSIEHHILIRIVFIVTHYTHARSAHMPNVLFVIALEFSSKPSLYTSMKLPILPSFRCPHLRGLYTIWKILNITASGANQRRSRVYVSAYNTTYLYAYTIDTTHRESKLSPYTGYR